MCCFFFSSRRRHTRYIGDWSSDVCSSDLITSNLKNMRKKIERVTDDSGNLREVDQVVRYLRHVEKKFDALIPDLKELLTDPYVSVADRKSVV